MFPRPRFTGLIQHDPSKDGVIRHGHSLKLNAWANRELQMKLCLLADGLGVTSLLRNVAPTNLGQARKGGALGVDSSAVTFLQRRGQTKF